MNNYKAQKLVEWFLMNAIMNKNVKYQVTEYRNKKEENLYIIHNLKAEIEEGIIWFGREDILDIPLDLIANILITDNVVNIILVDNKNTTIEIVK